MKQHIYLLMILILLVTTCSELARKDNTATTISDTPGVLINTQLTITTSESQQVRTTATPSTTQMPVPEQLFSLTNTPNKTPEFTQTPTPLQGFISPRVMKICQENRMVKLTDLDMSSELRLLLLPPDIDLNIPSRSGVTMISKKNMSPELLPNTVPAGEWRNYGYRTINGGKQLVFYRSKEGGTEKEIWISSIDENQLWRVAAIDTGSYFQWISNQEAVIIGISQESNQTRNYSKKIMPLFRINPLTKLTDSLKPLPEGSIFDTYFVTSNQHYAIYHTEGNLSELGIPMFSNFTLYNYDEDTSQPIFRWLDNKLQVDVFNFHLYTQRTGTDETLFGAVVSRPYGIDFVMNLDLQAISRNLDYQEEMSSIIIPGDFDSTVAFPLIGDHSIGIERFNMFSSLDEASKLYVLDYTDMILKDYCLNRENSLTHVEVSPDGRFLALTFFVTDSNTIIAREVVILNLETGNISSIPSWNAIGWGMVDEQSLP